MLKFEHERSNIDGEKSKGDPHKVLKNEGLKGSQKLRKHLKLRTAVQTFIVAFSILNNDNLTFS